MATCVSPDPGEPVRWLCLNCGATGWTAWRAREGLREFKARLVEAHNEYAPGCPGPDLSISDE